jgi:hypothetical protein
MSRVRRSNREILTARSDELWRQFCAAPPEVFASYKINVHEFDFELPAGIKKVAIWCDVLKKFPKLPEGVVYFKCGGAYLNGSPLLPKTLVTLDYDVCNFDLGSENLPRGLKNLRLQEYNYGSDYPPGLEVLSCNSTARGRHELGKLPESLKCFIHDDTSAFENFSSLSEARVGIECLIINHGDFEEIGTPPESVTWLNLCMCTGFTREPRLPMGLKYLNLSRCDDLVELTELPEGLLCLDIGYNSISSIGRLPNSLVELYCGGCELTSLPKLPDGLKILYCDDQSLDGVLEVPAGLRRLDCSSTEVSEIRCEGGRLTDIETLICARSKVTALPELPEKMNLINVNRCSRLRRLPFVRRLNQLACKYCSFTSLPPVEEVRILHCSGTPLLYLPEAALGVEDSDLGDVIRGEVVTREVGREGEAREVIGPSLLELAGAAVLRHGLAKRVEVAELREFIGSDEFGRCRGCGILEKLRLKVAEISTGLNVQFRRCWRCAINPRQVRVEWPEIPELVSGSGFHNPYGAVFEKFRDNYAEWFVVKQIGN